MSDNKNFYITTPIYYVNDIPHIGHAYTTTACDAIARYKRMKGYDVHFLTGTDEHGQKIQVSAEAKGKTPQELVDEIHMNFKKLWQVLNISNDDFIRTTEERHIKKVQEIFSRLISQGDIYKGKYSGYYCVPDETYVPENAIIEHDGKKTCPDCGRELIIMEEESYFFKGSKYVPELIKFYEEHVKAVMPKIRYNEIMSFLKGGVKEQSVSRTSLKWGIPVPGDEKHVIYVWFDALINYISALDDKDFNKYWPCVRHMVGKDIIRFHCVTWPLMLLALGLPLPVEIIAHGWWTVDGEKMSKTRKNVVDPFKIVDEYGLDPFRYFLLREVPFGNDGDFSELALVNRINSDLANDLGNLLNRTLQMINNYRSGIVPGSSEISPLSELAPEILSRVDEAMNNYSYDEALKSIWEFISRANKFIDETLPWKLAKDETQQGKLDYVLLNLYEALRLSGLLIAPFMPDTSKRLYAQLGINSEPVKMLYENFSWGAGAGTRINKAEVLFPRIDVKAWHKAKAEVSPVARTSEFSSLRDNMKAGVSCKQAEANARVFPSQSTTAQPQPAPVNAEQVNEIGIEDFAKVEMRVAKIINVEEIPRSKKLYKLEVDLGYETRTVCSGIKAFFSPEELMNKRVILVTNLKPAKLCGIMSNGMILAASVKHDGVAETLTLLTPLDENIPLGSKVS